MEFMPGTSDVDIGGSSSDASRTFLEEERGSKSVDPGTPGKTGNESGEPENLNPNPTPNDTRMTDSVQSSTSVDEGAGDNEGPAETTENAVEPEDEWLDILGNGNFKKRVIVAGEKDSRPTKSDILKVKYVGKLEDGTIVENVECAEINLGDCEVVQGLDLTLALMDKYEEAEVVIHSRFAYGELGRQPDIPPGAVINYIISLLDVSPEPLISCVSYADRLTIGGRKKDRGNWWYTRDEYTLAINCYRRALFYLDETELPGGPRTEDEIRVILDERLKTYNNLGAAQIKIEGYDAALISFGHVLAAQPNNVKALFRKSQILKAKGELNEAISVIQKALSIEPENRRLQADLQVLLAAQRRENSTQRDLYKKMMGNSEDQTSKKKQTQKTSRVKWLAIVTTLAVAAGSIIAFRYRM